MKLSSSTKIALSTSLILCVSNFLLLYYLNLDFLKIVSISFFIFMVNFLSTKYTIKKFISKRLKPIFKTIYDKPNVHSEILTIDKIQEDALDWKNKKDKSIIDLQQQINFRKEFIGNISHEIKTPLFSIQGYVDTLLDGGLEDDTINRSYLKKASKNIERLSGIVTDLDTISKIESNALKLNFEIFNICDLINETLGDLEFLADKNDVKIFFKENFKKIFVKADRQTISEVLINLISNSLKYGIENGKTKISIHDLEGKILIRIQDNGLGIKEEQLPRIFERFYRIDENRSRDQGGSGLGLAIVKHFIEAHNQTIHVKSEFGKGSSFEFTLDKS